MTAYDVEQGDAVHPGDPVIVDRYTPRRARQPLDHGNLPGLARGLRPGACSIRASSS